MGENLVDFDTPWKDVIEGYFSEFIAFFFPDAYAEIDWQHGHEFLDKEFQQIIRESEFGRRYVDKLVKVWTLHAEERWVLVHIEVQSHQDADFAERMYIYSNRIYDRYARPVASLAVFTDESPRWQPDRFEYTLWGCHVLLEFPSVKLIQYRDQEQELENSDNPFAVVVLAHLRTMASRKNADLRLQWKLELCRSLFRRGYIRQEVIDLLRFIDWVMALPKELDNQFWITLQHFEEVQTMPYITSFERNAIQRGHTEGLQQGLQQGLRKSILTLLMFRFGVLTEAVTEKIAAIHSAEQLEQVMALALKSESLEAFVRQLPNT